MPVSLDKRTESAQNSMISLIKTGVDQGLNVDDITAACVLVMDHSGSMSRLYGSGDVQEVAERTLAAALAGLDDDGDVQVHFFDNVAYPVEEVNVSNYAGFVNSWRGNRSMGGTKYLPVISQVIHSVMGGTITEEKKGLFSRKKVTVSQASLAKTAGLPTLVFFVTDGDPRGESTEDIKQELINASHLPIFWQFIGIGGYSPAFLRELDNMPGRVVDNVGLTEVQSASSITDDQWFTEMLREFILEWTPAARAAGIIRSS